MTANCCPTCGAELRDQFCWDAAAGVFVANGIAVHFTNSEAKVMDSLWRHRNRGAIPDMMRFMEIVYADDIDGGPETTNNIAVHLYSVRKRLESAGYTVTYNIGRPKRGYKLVKVEAERA